MKRHKIMNVREFRGNFQRLTEPVMVLRRSEILGTWIPDVDRTGVRYPDEQPDTSERPERTG